MHKVEYVICMIPTVGFVPTLLFLLGPLSNNFFKHRFISPFSLQTHIILSSSFVTYFLSFWKFLTASPSEARASRYLGFFLVFLFLFFFFGLLTFIDCGIV